MICICPDNSAFYLTLEEEITDSYRKKICFGTDVISITEEKGDIIKKLRLKPSAESFVKSIMLTNEEGFIKAENHNGKLDIGFKVKTEIFNQFKDKLKHGKRN